MGFKAIKQLKLKEAFVGNQKFDSITEDDDFLKELFECESRAQLYICDDNLVGHSVFIPNTEGIGKDKVFKVKNSEHKDVFLWHIDGVLFEKESKCDCAVFTDKDLNFIELKTNAINRSEEAIQDNYQKASDQLLNTLEEVSKKCHSVEVEIRDLVKIKAFAVFNRSVPSNDALRKNISIRFLLESKGIKLVFGNECSL